MKKSKGLNCAFLSDVHLGHRRTPTAHLLESLENSFPDGHATADLDLIIIAGDLFDKGLHYTDPNVRLIERWAIRFLRRCKKYNIALRILEGTHAHDMGQASSFLAFNEAGRLGVDLRYVDRLEIEDMTKLGLSILYLPDEWRANPDETWLEVKAVMGHRKQVDLVVMHGMFDHQVPDGAFTQPHLCARYEQLVQHYVVVGHIHQPSCHGRILAPGSLDRLAHGEQGQKGHWRATLRSDAAQDKVFFQENSLAFPYLTVDCRQLGFEAATEKVTAMGEQPSGAFLRLRVQATETSGALFQWCKKNYPQYNWTLIKDNDDRSERACPPFDLNQPQSLTATALPARLEEKMKAMGVDTGIIDQSLTILSDMLPQEEFKNYADIP